MVASNPETDKDAPESFEEELMALEEAVEKLEAGELTLEKAIRSFESGCRSLKHCYGILQKAQRRIEILCSDAAGEQVEDGGESGAAFSWKPLELDGMPLAELNEREGDAPVEESTDGSASSRSRATEHTRGTGKDRLKSELEDLSSSASGHAVSGGQDDEPLSYADDFAGPKA